MKFRHLLAIAFAVVLFPTIALGQATFDADAMSEFTLNSTGGMVISFETDAELPSFSTTGTGIASIDGDMQTYPGGTLMPGQPFTLSVGQSVFQTSEISGSAGPPGGTSNADVLNSVLVILDNTANGTANTAEFTFTYTWDASIAKTDPDMETATASPFFHLSGFAPSGAETLMIDDGMGGGPVPVADWLVHPNVSSPSGDLLLADSSTGTATVTAFVTVPAGGFDSFQVITDAFGGAAHTVPEPTSIALWSLLGLGLAGFGYRRLRRKK